MVGCSATGRASPETSTAPTAQKSHGTALRRQTAVAAADDTLPVRLTTIAPRRSATATVRRSKPLPVATKTSFSTPGQRRWTQAIAASTSLCPVSDTADRPASLGASHPSTCASVTAPICRTNGAHCSATVASSGTSKKAAFAAPRADHDRVCTGQASPKRPMSPAPSSPAVRATWSARGRSSRAGCEATAWGAEGGEPEDEAAANAGDVASDVSEEDPVGEAFDTTDRTASPTIGRSVGHHQRAPTATTTHTPAANPTRTHREVTLVWSTVRRPRGEGRWEKRKRDTSRQRDATPTLGNDPPPAAADAVASAHQTMRNPRFHRLFGLSGRTPVELTLRKRDWYSPQTLK